MSSFGRSAVRISSGDSRPVNAGRWSNSSANSRSCSPIPDPVDPPAVLRDREDDYLIALADAGQAVAIITGDNDLLEHLGLDPPALTPRDACDRFSLR